MHPGSLSLNRDTVLPIRIICNDREVSYDAEDGARSYRVSRVPQGSVLGPLILLNKTEVVLITCRKIIEFARFQVDNVSIESKVSIKLLEAMLDNRLSFRPRVDCSSFEPFLGRRWLHTRFGTSVLLYAVTIWASAEARQKGPNPIQENLTSPFS